MSTPARPHGPRVVVRARQLSVHYGTHVAVDRVDLDLLAGELVALVGRNGAGKSSLLGALAGAVPHHGRVDRVTGTVAYVPQRAAPLWELPLSVADVVATGRLQPGRWWRRPGPADREVVAEAMARLDLLPLAGRPVSTLSGGQAQRVLLARALAQRPAALLLDEPCSGLDLAALRALEDTLAGLAGAGIAVMAAVHEPVVALGRYDRVVTIDRCLVGDGAAPVIGPGGPTVPARAAESVP